MGSDWDPTQYLKFSDLRLRPALDLLDRVGLEQPGRVVDLGCGTGNVTRIIAQRWPAAAVVGIDSSTDMLAKAQKSESRILWRQADLSAWTASEPVHLIYSNATLHWLPNHEALFPRLLEQLVPEGVLAVQMPLSWHLPSHRLMRDVLATGGTDGKPLGPQALRQGLSKPPVWELQAYYDLLVSRTRHLDIWTTEYLHVLEGGDAVLEWVKSTGLRPVLNSLDEKDLDRFLAQYRDRLAEAYPQGPDGRTLYPFARLFIVATI